MPAAWVGAAAGVLGTINSMDANSAQQQQQAQSATDARNASQQQLDFAKQQYADNQPYTQAMQQAAVQSAGLDNQVAQQQAARSQTAWDQNQSIAGPASQVVGLNSLGAQYLTPEQQQEMQQLQQTLGQSQYTTTPGATTTPTLSAADQARMQQLLSMQQNQGKKTIGPTGTAADQGLGTPQWHSAAEDAATSGQGFAPAAGLMGAAGTAPTTQFTPELQAELAALQAKAAPQTGASTQTINPQVQAAQAAARTRLAELQQAANQAAQQREIDKANLITGTAGKYGQQEVALGEEAAQSGLSDAQTLQDLVRSRAAQRAQANELRGTTQSNADISSAADQANRQLLRLGGDPNKMAAMAADTANAQQLARITGGNQVAGQNISMLNQADDTALGIQSSALDAARQARIGAKQAALGLNLTGQQQADTLTGNAKDTADTKLNLLAQGGANMGLGFANTSAQTAQGAISGGTAGVTNLNAASNGGLNGINAMNNGTQSVLTGSRIGSEAGTSAFNSAQTGLSAVQKNIGTVAGSVAGGGGLSGLVSKIPSVFNFGTSGNNYNGSSSDSSAPNYTNSLDQGFQP